jgi:hypothetical protein
MKKYRKKPLVIEAAPFEWGMESGVKRYNEYIPKETANFPVAMLSKKYEGYLGRYDSELEERGFERGEWNPYIETLEGQMIIGKGDYIIKGIKGEFYPCKPDIFEATYEEV